MFLPSSPVFVAGDGEAFDVFGEAKRRRLLLGQGGVGKRVALGARVGDLGVRHSEKSFLVKVGEDWLNVPRLGTRGYLQTKKERKSGTKKQRQQPLLHFYFHVKQNS